VDQQSHPKLAFPGTQREHKPNQREGIEENQAPTIGASFFMRRREPRKTGG